LFLNVPSCLQLSEILIHPTFAPRLRGSNLFHRREKKDTMKDDSMKHEDMKKN